LESSGITRYSRAGIRPWPDETSRRQAQYHRTEADYNTSRRWDLTEVLLHIDGIVDAFKSWKIISQEPVAQAYLVSMLASKERRQNERPSPEKRPTLTDVPKKPGT
jgi:hypothetical protein